MAVSIGDWIEKLESNRSLSQEEFYAKLKGAACAIQERLDMAQSDGIDLEMIDPADDDY